VPTIRSLDNKTCRQDFAAADCLHGIDFVAEEAATEKSESPRQAEKTCDVFGGLPSDRGSQLLSRLI
jgi:hypothetical protein